MKFFNTTLFAGLCLFGINGCGLDSMVLHRRASLPTEWKNAGGFPVGSADRDLAQWWNRFEDRTLTQVIAEALKNNPGVASATARVRESQARRNSEAATLFPTLNGLASAGSSTAWADAGGHDSQSSSAARINAVWEVDLFGKRRSSIEAAAAQLGATQENFRAVQAALASEIAIAYTTLRVNEAGLEVLLRTIKTREETSRLANWRKEAGEADSLESNQALTSLEQARAAQPAFEQAISQTRNLLARLSGQNPGALDAMLGTGKQAIPNPSRTLAIGIPADTLRQRPDVRIAGFQLLAAAATSRAVQAERFPSLNLSGSLGVNALGAGKLFNPETTTAGVIAGLSGPIFDAGRIRSNIQAQSAVEEQACQNYRSAILTALSEVEDSLIACRRTTERLEILERATAAAREAAGLAQQRYEAGVTDILTVLDAQRSLLGLEDSLFSIRASRTIAFIQLYKALGGGWS